MDRIKIYIIPIILILLNASTLFAQLEPLSGKEDGKSWSGKELKEPYKIKPIGDVVEDNTNDNNVKPDEPKKPIISITIDHKKSTKLIESEMIREKIKLFYFVTINNFDRTKLKISLFSRRTKDGEREVLKPIILSIPKNSAVQLYEYVVGDYTADYDFQLRIESVSDMSFKPINSKIFNCSVKKQPKKVDPNLDPSEYWIKGGLFAQEEIPDDQPGVYGFFESGRAHASLVLGESGVMRYPDDSDDELSKIAGWGKLYLQIDIPVVDYFQLQIGAGGLACFMYNSDVNTYFSNMEFKVDGTDESSERFGWLIMGGFNWLWEGTRHFGMMLWEQTFFGMAGFTDYSYIFFQARGGLRFFIQFTEEGGFTIFFGPEGNFVSLNRDEDPEKTYTKPPIGIEAGLHFLNGFALKFFYGFNDMLEARLSFGKTF